MVERQHTVPMNITRRRSLMMGGAGWLACVDACGGTPGTKTSPTPPAPDTPPPTPHTARVEPPAPAAAALTAARARALALRDQALRAGDQPYGAVVIDPSGRIIGEAPSRVVARGDTSAHAEREALREAMRELGRNDLSGMFLVSSARPCAVCEDAAAAAGIERMFHGTSSDAGQPRPTHPHGPRPLVALAAAGNLPAVQRALLAGAAVNQRESDGRNAVLAATQGGHVEVARVLIAHGADVNAQDQSHDSAFLLAGARGHTEIVRLALAAGADPRRVNRYGGTALIPAAHHGHVDTVRLLLADGRIAIDHVYRLGWTALLEAIILGDGAARHSQIAQLLLAHGANPNLADAQGVSPLQHALQRHQAGVADQLRAAGGR